MSPRRIGAERLWDHEPMDVIFTAPDGSIHGIEVKTLVDNQNDKITMHKASLQRKLDWAKENGATIHTVVFDERDVFMDGKNASQYSGHKLYYATKVGSFRLGALTKAESFDQIRELIEGGGV